MISILSHMSAPSTSMVVRWDRQQITMLVFLIRPSIFVSEACKKWAFHSYLTLSSCGDYKNRRKLSPLLFLYKKSIITRLFNKKGACNFHRHIHDDCLAAKISSSARYFYVLQCSTSDPIFFAYFIFFGLWIEVWNVAVVLVFPFLSYDSKKRRVTQLPRRNAINWREGFLTLIK